MAGVKVRRVALGHLLRRLVAAAGHQARPARRAPDTIATVVGQRANPHETLREVLVQAHEVHAESAALAAAVVPDARTVHLGERNRPVHRAVNAENGVVEEALLTAHGNAGGGVRDAVFLHEAFVLRLVLRILFLWRPGRLERMHVHDERDRPRLRHHLRLGTRRPRTRHVHLERPRPLRSIVRNGEQTPHPLAAEGGEAHLPQLEPLPPLHGQRFATDVDRHVAAQAFPLALPVGIEICRTRETGTDLLRLVADAGTFVALAKAERRFRHPGIECRRAQEARLVKRAFQDDRILLRGIDLARDDRLRAEVVEPHLDLAADTGLAKIGTLYPELGLFADRTHPCRIFARDLERIRGGERRRGRDHHAERSAYFCKSKHLSLSLVGV